MRLRVGVVLFAISLVVGCSEPGGGWKVLQPAGGDTPALGDGDGDGGGDADIPPDLGEPDGVGGVPDAGDTDTIDEVDGASDEVAADSLPSVDVAGSDIGTDVTSAPDDGVIGADAVPDAPAEDTLTPDVEADVAPQDTGAEVCVPSCPPNQCGGDGCGGSCNVGGACDDGDPCTAGDVCDNAGACGGEPVSCDDGDPCTSDSCGTGGCVHTPIPGCGAAPCEGCPAETPYCLETSGPEDVCVACLDDAHCPGAQVCTTVTYECVDPGEIVTCTTDADCPASDTMDLFCDTATHRCVDTGGVCDGVVAFCLGANPCVSLLEMFGGGDAFPLPGTGATSIPGSCACEPDFETIPGLGGPSADCPGAATCSLGIFSILQALGYLSEVPYTCSISF